MGLDPIKDVNVKPEMSVEELIELYGSIHGFGAAHLYEAVSILREMVVESDLRFISFTGNLVATGLRGLLAQLIASKIFNVVVTTCGTVDHDIARAMGGQYLRGSFDIDDSELRRLGYHRIGNVLVHQNHYGKLVEDFVKKLLKDLVNVRSKWGVRELLHEAGLRIHDKNSILHNASIYGVPIYVPGITDGAFGTALFIHSQFMNFELNLFKDMKELSDMVFTSKKSGALIIGGGISKHHTLWWNQFKDGLDYAVYVTTAVEWDGSLSGARTKEAISWGKVKESGKHIVVYSDASLVLPIIATYLISLSAKSS
ncbi:MAG: deoxyhypusine synthase [Sulfolobales archaeon]|nr:deoxyhypusine synthase [Sulfolobales archaeon]MDW7970127.1 deoxyhypusine synthase [Sulfolobales archaeon]